MFDRALFLVSRLVLMIVVGAGLVACATSTALHQPRNLRAPGSASEPAERQIIRHKGFEYVDFARTLNRRRCSGPLLPRADDAHYPYDEADRLSVGDILRVDVADGADFSADVEVAADGTIDLPFLPPIAAAHLTLPAVEDAIAHQLVAGNFFKRGFVVVTAELKHTGSRRVSVSGAVFQPGVFVMNAREGAAFTQLQLDASGDGDAVETVADALRRAGGIRPDADVANVVLVRNGQRRVLDMTGAFTGLNFENTKIRSGDLIMVPSRGCFQEALVRASAVTAPGVRLFMSNLTRPALNNASSAIGRDATNLPYGARLLQAVVSANCVGGTHVTNANRYVVYITRDWHSGRTVVVERPIEALVRRADRDNFNPYLQEGDAIACYDSAVTNARDVIQTIGEALSPAIFTRGLIGGL